MVYLADGKTVVFKIRQGVKFQNGETMTPSDVAYSLQRGMLQGGTASPQWMYYEAFFGVGTDDVSLLVDPEGNLYDDRENLAKADPATLKAACEKVKAAVVADDAAGTVTLTLAQPWAPLMATLTQTWGSVMNQKWVVENKGWDGHAIHGRITMLCSPLMIPSPASPWALAPTNLTTAPLVRRSL
jgi:peptide/nickel transport system substrate-binding protein